jgi:glycosyltransferase involved in cell wall biosynthesis
VSVGLSVITTCFNREAYIGQAIESVLNSSFSDFEYIIVDDCSTDASVEVAQSYIKKDNRIRLFVNERNLGDYPNRNRAAEHAAGQYIKYVDSDDVIYSHGLQVMMDCMKQFPQAALGLSRPSDPAHPFPMELSPAETYRRHFLVDGLLSYGPLSAIIKKDCFEAVGHFSGRRFIGDNELWLKLSAQYPVVLMPDGLTWYRHHAGQEIAAGNLAYKTAYRDVALAALSDKHCPLTADKINCAKDVVRLQQSKIAWLLLRHGHFKECCFVARSSQLRLRDYWAGFWSLAR